MTVATHSLRTDGSLRCIACQAVLEHNARFCGECGAKLPAPAFAAPNRAANINPSQMTSHSFESGHAYKAVATTANLQAPQAAKGTAPSFAHAANRAPVFARVDKSSKVDSELSRELGELLVTLLRERLFLLMHWIIFLATNAFGFLLAAKCYYEYNCDELTRLVMATTPLIFINSVGLVCLSPIKGTKREIARLQERISYVKFRIRFKHLL